MSLAKCRCYLHLLIVHDGTPEKCPKSKGELHRVCSGRNSRPCRLLRK
jgi:hypothetical protein